ncbi:MAG: hypothetical protein RL220_1704 [Bacteroidota bacterium]
MRFSYWEERTFLRDIDLLVVGGGIVGLSTAIYARRSNPSARVVLIEMDAFSAGASSRNAGFACFGSPSEILDDLTVSDEETVFSTVERRFLGLANLRELVGDHNLNYEPVGGYEVFSHAEADLLNACTEKLDWLNQRLAGLTGGITYRKADVESMGIRGIAGAFFNPFEGLIDTGRLLLNLLQIARNEGVMVLNGLKIDAISSLSDGAAAIIGGDEIRVKRAVLCTNGLATRLIPELDVNPARNQVIVTSPIEGLDLKGGFHMNRGYVYFRNVGDQVLIGGFRNTAPEREATAELGLTDDIQALLEETLREIVIPGKNFTVERRWSGIMGLGKTKKPIIDEVRPNIFAAVRMGGMGVAIGSLVGREVARLAMEGK